MVMAVMSVFSVTRAKYCSESSVTSRLLAKNQEHGHRPQTVFAYRLMGTRKTFTERAETGGRSRASRERMKSSPRHSGTRPAI